MMVRMAETASKAVPPPLISRGSGNQNSFACRGRAGGIRREKRIDRTAMDCLTEAFMNKLTLSLWMSACIAGAAQVLVPAGAATSAAVPSAAQPGFRVLALAEAGGHHVAFTKAAKVWLKRCGEENRFEVDYLTNTAPITEAFLARYALVLQLDFVPYGWTPESMAAFKSFIEQGKGGWVGLHHASLLGSFDGYPMWPWFHDFMGKIQFKNYIPQFAAGTVRVEDREHPCMKGLGESFVISREEWYTYDHSPRPNVHVLASVDESTYSPDSTVKMGDHPVVWTNERMAARNVYIFMGHGPDLFENVAFTTLLRNAVLGAAGTPKPKTDENRTL